MDDAKLNKVSEACMRLLFISDTQADIPRQSWLEHIFEILECMRAICSDYSRIAAEEDEDYRRYSPYMNEAMAATMVLEFDIDEPLPTFQKPKIFSKASLKWLGIWNKRISEGVDSWKWALIEKRKFEGVLGKFQEHNGKLKDILPLYLAFQVQSSRGTPGLSRLMDSQDEHAQRLGIARHARLQELLSGSHAETANIFLNDSHLDATEGGEAPIPGRLSNPGTRSRERILVEYKSYLPDTSDVDPEPEEMELHCRAIRQLANLLISAGSNDMLTLPLRGIISQEEQHRYAFLFDFPHGIDKESNPVSLFSLIEGKSLRSRLDLPQRFLVAEQVAKSMGAFHADGWVHKSMRSNSVLFFQGRDAQNDILVKSPYLVNFEYSRPETAMTKYDFDNDLERNLYRHPDRQGRPKTSFSKLHDIYALGVVLLEIGLWETAPSLYQRAARRLPPGQTLSPAAIRLGFIEAAKQRLGHHMGPGYVSAVLACLTGKFSNLTSRADFPMMFHEDVIEKLGISGIFE